jgi:hypothetical protein
LPWLTEVRGEGLGCAQVVEGPPKFSQRMTCRAQGKPEVDGLRVASLPRHNGAEAWRDGIRERRFPAG